MKPATHSGFSLPPDGISHFLDSALFKWQVLLRITGWHKPEYVNER
ncbi:MAG: hypothetical protein WDA74_02425 [Spirochaetota bacterium]